MSLIFSSGVNRSIFITSFLVFILVPIFSKSQTWLWAKSVTGTGWDEGYSVSADASGNVFQTGSFTSSTITFGSTTLANSGISVNKPSEIFIAKYDANGNVLWAKSATGTGWDEGYSVNADAGGNVFVTGWFDSPTITFSSTILTNGGSSDVFIAKYDANGNVLWAKSVAGTGSDIGWSVSADASGNVFVTGRFDSPTITFGSTTLSNANAGSVSSDIFIAKYDANGNMLWAKSIGGINDDEGYSVGTDAGGNVFVTGNFKSPAITFGSTTLTNVGGSCLGSGSGGCADVFIAKYDATGNVLWAKSAGGTNLDYGYSVSADASGNVFVTGYYYSPTITFGSTTLTNADPSIETSDVFIAKYDPTGNMLWAKSAGGTSIDREYCVSTDAGGNVFTTGFFYSPSITFGSNTLTQPLGSYDPMFIVKYDAAGNVLCASALASGGDEQGGVSADPFGNVYMGGDFYNVNPFIVGSDTLNLTAGVENVFIAKYTCGCVLVANIKGDTIVCTGSSVTLTASASGGTNYLWSTGATGSSITVNPSSTTSYTVVVSNGVCIPDTVYKTITVCPDYTFFIPNSFTPNGDGLNDVFLPQTALAALNKYSLIIFDRWGEKVFESNNYKQGWDGKVKNTNTIAQQDVYIWKVNLSDFQNQQHDYFGRVTLLLK